MVSHGGIGCGCQSYSKNSVLNKSSNFVCSVCSYSSYGNSSKYKYTNRLYGHIMDNNFYFFFNFLLQIQNLKNIIGFSLALSLAILTKAYSLYFFVSLLFVVIIFFNNKKKIRKYFSSFFDTDYFSFDKLWIFFEKF